MRDEGVEHEWLSFEPVDREAARTHFANIRAHCLEEGRDILSEPIPVVPTQHYFMGGVWVDKDGRTSMPELYAAETAKARLVANPGCYPSSAILGLYAAFKHGLISPDNIVIDSKSGTSGAGRKPVVPSLFCEVYDTFRAYGLGKHRHTPEIEQEYSRAAGCDVRVSFNPHLVPMVRGILSTIYTTLRKPGTTLDEVHAAYCETWAQSPWVRVLPKGKLPETRFVRGSMFCDLGLVVDPRTNRLIVVSAIDNLCRGASGQALANANLMCGLPVDCGLNAAPMLP